MEVIKFILFAFLLFGAWSYIVLPSYLDAARDQLFDLRDELRETFLANGWNMSSDKYAEARTVVNSYLRFTEELTFWKLLYIQYRITREADRSSSGNVVAHNRRASDQLSEVDIYISKLRSRALHVTIGYAVSTSFFLNMFALAYLPIYAVGKVFGLAGRGMRSFLVGAMTSLKDLPSILTSGIAFAERYLGNLIFKETVIEQYSMRYRYSH